MSKTKYFTTTLPYANAKPHIAHAREFVMADVFRRIYNDLGYQTFLNVGTDEHGLKIFRKAKESNLEVQAYVDEQVKTFVDFCRDFEIGYDRFMRTTDDDHKIAVQKFWKICQEKGYIYKKNYQIKYCVGCELEKTDSDLVDGKCLDHPGNEIEIISEENYFFKFSAFGEKLLKFYQENPDFVKPLGRFKEIKAFVENGLEDFSISRLKNKVPWGVSVPGDEEQVIYVWFDALVNYISAIGWPDDLEVYQKWIPMVQFCGKDNLRQQSAMWQAMLMAAGLENSMQVLVNGFIVSDGQKMSKSIGNVIDPFELKEKFGLDATRYLLLVMNSFGGDVDITVEKMIEKYNTDLANGVGNLTSRLLTLYTKIEDKIEIDRMVLDKKDWEELLREGKVELIASKALMLVRDLDAQIEKDRPWELIKKDLIGFKKLLKIYLKQLLLIAEILNPFMPSVSMKIEQAIENKEKIYLFPRIENK